MYKNVGSMCPFNMLDVTYICNMSHICSVIYASIELMLSIELSIDNCCTHLSLCTIESANVYR